MLKKLILNLKRIKYTILILYYKCLIIDISEAYQNDKLSGSCYKQHIKLYENKVKDLENKKGALN